MINAQKYSAGSIIKHLLVLLLVVIWTLPTLGLFISSVRDKDQLIISGWWTALSSTETNNFYRTATAEGQIENNGVFVISGDFFAESQRGEVLAWGERPTSVDEFEPDTTSTLNDGSRLTVNADGTFRWESDEPFTHRSGKRIFFV